MAHMPTYYSAAGRETDLRTTLTSIKDQPGQLQMKYRKSGQSTSEEVGDRDKVVEQLKKKEATELSKKDKALAYVVSEEKKVNTLLLTNAPSTVTADTVASLAGKYDDADPKLGPEDDENGDGFDSSSEEESDDEDDDEAELLAELERIRGERAAAKEKKEAEEQEEKGRKAFEEAKSSIMKADGESARIKRRWNDDVVFRNNARDESSKKPRFINDPLRSDFHRQFMKKYMK